MADKHSKGNIEKRLSPLRITILYALISVFWISFSDKLLTGLTTDYEILVNLQTYKGWGFVAITSVLLYILINEYSSQILSSEESLKRSEELWKFALEGAGDGVWDWNAQTNEVFFSRRWKEMLEYEEHEIGNTLDEWETRVHPDDKKMVYEEIEKHFRGETDVYVSEHRMLCKDGTYKWILDRGKIVTRTDEGKPLRVVGTHTDITERKRAEEALQKSEEQFRVIASHTPDHILMQDSELKYLFVVNPQLGLTEQDMIGKSDYDFLSKEEADKLTEIKNRVLKIGQPVNLEASLISKAGEIEYFDGTYVPKFDARGQIDGLIGYFRNVTDRKQAEKKILRITRLYTILSKINEAIIRTREPQELYEQACKVAVEDGEFLMVWIGLVDPETSFIKPVAHYGHEEGYLENIRISINPDIPEGKGPTGSAMREGRYFICNDIQNDPHMLPWREEALKRGYHSSAAFPLITDSGIIGSINFYLSEPFFFKEEEEVKLLSALADDLSFSIEAMENEEKRKQAQEKLRESKLQLETTIKASNIGLWDWDLKTNKVYFSPEWKRQIGYEDLEILNDFSESQSRVHPDDIERMLKTVNEYIKNPWPNYEVEFRFRHKDGSYRWILTKASLLKDEDGIPIRMLGSHLDITERKNTEELLRKSEDKFKHVFESANVGKSITLPTGEINVNKAFADLLGYTQEELRNKTWQELTPPDEIEAIQKMTAPLLNGEKDAVRFDKRYIHKNGSHIWTDVSIAIRRDSAGKPLHFITTIVDITERRRAWERVKKQSSLLTAINRIFKEALHCETEWELGETCLAVAEELTGSKFGFIGELEETGKFSDVALSNPGWDECSMPESDKAKLIKHMEVVSYWGRTIKEGKSQLVNAPSSDTDRRGLPEGHPPITSFLGVPLKYNDKVVGMIALANKTNGYTPEDQENIESISSSIVEVFLRKRAEEALQYHEVLLEETGKIAKVGGWEFDPVTGKGTWTDEVARIHDLDPEEYTYVEKGLNLYQSESRTKIENAVKEAIEVGKSYDLELELITEKGNHKWVRTIGHPIIENEKVVKVRGSFQDITERKQLEHEREKFIHLADSSSEFIGMCDLEMNPVYVNPAGIRMVGLSDMRAACSVKVQDYFFPEDQDFIRDEFFPRVLREGHGDVEIRLRHFQTGEPIWMFYYLFHVLDANGNPIGWATVSRDITERRKAEEELRLTNEELLAINRIITTTTTTTTTGVNEILGKVMDEALNIAGLEGGTICLVSDDTLHLAVHRATSEATIKDLSEGQIRIGDCLCGDCARDHKPLILPDREAVLKYSTREATRGEDIRFHAAFPLIIAGKCLGVLCVFTRTDKKPAERRLKLLETITSQVAIAVRNAQLYEDTIQYSATLEDKVRERTSELKQANIRLKELDRLKSMFIASMSHELRTPLNSVIGFSSILMKDWVGTLNDEQKNMSSIILKAGKHLLSLINDVIDVSKIEAGMIDIHHDEFDMDEVITDAVESLAKDIEDKGLLLNIATIHQKMHTDRGRLLQCILNLLSNAMKFTEKGSITVQTRIVNSEQYSVNSKKLNTNNYSLTTDMDFVEISVTDTGIGIQEEDIPKLFQAFVRLETPLKTVVPGTGLGLYLTRKLITEVLQGDITVESEYGKGSRFIIKIPISVNSEK
jgi:PAS domain S-box-containing protein